MIRIGIIGLGVISKYYLKAFDYTAGVKLTAACDLDCTKLDGLSDRNLFFTTDYVEILKSSLVDAVIINLPNYLHALVVRNAIMEGKHVCCEKPLTLCADDSRELSRLAAASGSTLFTSFHRRYNENFLKAAEQLDPADPIVNVNGCYLEKIEDHAGGDTWYLDPTRCGGGCIADNGPNISDAIRALIGTLTLVDAHAVFDQFGVDRSAILIARSYSGIPVRMELDWSYQAGEKKDIQLTLQSGRKIEIDFLKGFAKFKSSLWHEYVGVLEDFARTICDGAETEADGIAANELVDAAYQILHRKSGLVEMAV